MPTLKINDFRLLAHIGCGQEERDIAQELSFSLTLTFALAPAACESDKIEDTLCYQSLCECIRDVVESKPYSTLEFLSARILGELNNLIPTGAKLKITTQKVLPPIPGLYGGASFEMETTT